MTINDAHEVSDADVAELIEQVVSIVRHQKKGYVIVVSDDGNGYDATTVYSKIGAGERSVSKHLLLEHDKIVMR